MRPWPRKPNSHPNGRLGGHDPLVVNLSLTMVGHDRPHGMVGIRRRAEIGMSSHLASARKPGVVKNPNGLKTKELSGSLGFARRAVRPQTRGWPT